MTFEGSISAEKHVQPWMRVEYSVEQHDGAGSSRIFGITTFVFPWSSRHHHAYSLWTGRAVLDLPRSSIYFTNAK